MRKLSSLVVVSSLIGLGIAGLGVASAPGCSGNPGTGSGFGGQAHDAGDASASRNSPVDDAGTYSGPTFGDFDADTADVGIGPSCATAMATATRGAVYMEIVLDGSGSMQDADKWTAVVPALDAIFDDFAKKNDPSFGVGFMIFSDVNDTGSGFGSSTPYPHANDVPVGIVNAAQHKALRDRLDKTSASGGTPTYTVLSGVYSHMENLRVAGLQPNGKKVVVLMTDGLPNGGDPEILQCTQAAAMELAKKNPEGPILTFSVGIGPFPSTGSDYNPNFMGDLAVAGGTRKSPTCLPHEAINPKNLCHFQVTPGGSVPALVKQFTDAINSIRDKVIGCEFILTNGEDGGVPTDFSKVNVVYTDGATGQQVPIVQNMTDGWTYDDPTNPTKVVIHGKQCDAIKSDPKASVQIVLGCKTATR